MRKNIIILLLAVATITLLVYCIKNKQSLTTITVEPSMDQIQTALHSESSIPDSQTAVSGEQVPQEKTIPVPDSEGAYETQRIQDQNEAPDKTPMMANLAEMLKDPAMKDMIRAQQKTTMDLFYGSFFEYLDLQPEELETFKDLLVEKQMALMDIGLEMMDSLKDSDKRQKSAERSKEITDEFNAKIREFLGETEYEVYQQFEQTQPERMQIQFFKQSLPVSDQLDEEQEHKLILAMHEERTNFMFSTDFSQNENLDPANMTEETITQYMDELGRVQDNYISRAGQILSDTQLEKFTSAMKQQRAMQEMGMKMAIKMFSQSSDNASESEPTY